MDLQNSRFTPAAKPMIKNISFAAAIDLRDLVDYQPGQVVSRTLAQNKHMNMSVFAFAEGEGLSTHSSTGDAMVQVLDGVGQFKVDQKESTVPAGQTIVLPANIPHAVHALENFKMLLTVVKPAV
jgi:quercetin dioxygenase-like cupin family protein